MRIVTLVENESHNRKLKASHGLSLYIETEDKKILFDLGPNNIYSKNAKQLGVDLSSVDILVISHGHYDHGSGLAKFLKLNRKADIYLAKEAFDHHVKFDGVNYLDIGIKKPAYLNRFVFVDKDVEIADGIHIVYNIPFKESVIPDTKLMTYENGRYVPDEFDHEIYLVIDEDERVALFSGCSHKGIEHIIDSIERKMKLRITDIIGGYHFVHYDSFNFKQTDYLTHLGQKFDARKDSRFYSCHCTGDEAFFQLKIHLKNKLQRLMTGSEIIL